VWGQFNQVVHALTAVSMNSYRGTSSQHFLPLAGPLAACVRLWGPRLCLQWLVGGLVLLDMEG
jgi:hypothetical protein